MSIDLIVNENGITTPTYAEILKHIRIYTNQYGDDIDVTSSNPDGQQLGIWASAALDLSNFGMFLSKRKSIPTLQKRVFSIAFQNWQPCKESWAPHQLLTLSLFAPRM